MTEAKRIAEKDISALAATVKAPESLRKRVQEMVDAASESHERQAQHALRARPIWRPRIAGAALGAAVAAAAAVLAVVLPGGSGGLTVQQAAALALSRPTIVAPAESAVNRSQLDMAVEGVRFPYWAERFGWRSAGARIDHAGGREVKTVFYASPEGRTIGYAIASGRAPATHGGTVRWRAGVPYRVLSQDGATVVTWPRDGHLCVISGRGVDARTLLRLAQSGTGRAGAA